MVIVTTGKCRPGEKDMKKTDIEIGGKILYVSETGKVRLGGRGPACEPGELLGSLPKGEARKVRKSARKAGHHRVAAAKRA